MLNRICGLAAVGLTGAEFDSERFSDLGVAEEELALVEALAAEPGGDFFVALAGIAGGAGGDNVIESVAAAAGNGEDAIALERFVGNTAVGAAGPRLLDGFPMLGAQVVLNSSHASFATASGTGFAGLPDCHKAIIAAVAAVAVGRDLLQEARCARRRPVGWN